MADNAFADRAQRAQRARKALAKRLRDRVAVDDNHVFSGFRAYQQLLESGVDMAILAEPPHFRPMHLEACVDAGVHVFAEKPMAVDAPGVRRVLAAGEKARQKNVSFNEVSYLVLGTKGRLTHDRQGWTIADLSGQRPQRMAKIGLRGRRVALILSEQFIVFASALAEGISTAAAHTPAMRKDEVHD